MTDPTFSSKSQVFRVPFVGPGGAVTASPSDTGPPEFASRSMIFQVQGTGGAIAASPSGAGPPEFASRSQVFMVLPSGEIVCECGITDSFERTDAGPQAWGFADIYNPDSGAGEWVVTDGNVGSTLDWEATVEGTYGRLWSEANGGADNGADPRARLYGLGVPQSFRMTWRVKFVSFDTASESVHVDFLVGALPSGAHSTVQFWFGDGIYLTSSGVGGTTRVDFDPTPGTWYRVRWEQDADDELRVRVWEDGDTEPGSWTLTKDVSTQDDWTDPNEFRIDCDQINGTPADALEVHFDDLAIEDVDTCMFDNFNRTIVGADSWGGTTPTDFTWVFSDPGGDITPSVAGGYGVFDCDANANEWMDVEDYPRIGNVAFTMTVRFLTGAFVPDGTGGNLDVIPFFVWWDKGDNPVQYSFAMSSHASFGELRIQPQSGGSGGEATVTKTDWLADTEYIGQVYQNPATNVCKMRVWEAADPEPSGWDLETTLTGIDLTHASPLIEFGMFNTATAYVFKIDYIKFDICPEE